MLFRTDTPSLRSEHTPPPFRSVLRPAADTDTHDTTLTPSAALSRQQVTGGSIPLPDYGPSIPGTEPPRPLPHRAEPGGGAVRAAKVAATLSARTGLDPSPLPSPRSGAAGRPAGRGGGRYRVGKDTVVKTPPSVVRETLYGKTCRQRGKRQLR